MTYLTLSVPLYFVPKTTSKCQWFWYTHNVEIRLWKAAIEESLVWLGERCQCVDIKYPYPVSSTLRALLTIIEFHERRGIRTILKYLTTDAHEKAKKKKTLTEKMRTKWKQIFTGRGEDKDKIIHCWLNKFWSGGGFAILTASRPSSIEVSYDHGKKKVYYGAGRL